jgi:outer membrane biosynthesis protein TonB
MMRRRRYVMTLTGLILIAPVLAGCADFDLDKLDVFGLNEKKKLPGERRELFPGGVPGVTQGIPPEFMKGNQPPPETAQAPAIAPDNKTASVEEEPKPKPVRKPKARTPSPASSKITVGGSQGAPQQQQQQTPWPQQDQQQPAQQQQPAPQQSQSPWPTQGQTNAAAPWPSSPSPGTFSR